MQSCNRTAPPTVRQVLAIVQDRDMLMLFEYEILSFMDSGREVKRRCCGGVVPLYRLVKNLGYLCLDTRTLRDRERRTDDT